MELCRASADFRRVFGIYHSDHCCAFWYVDDDWQLVWILSQYCHCIPMLAILMCSPSVRYQQHKLSGYEATGNLYSSTAKYL